MANDMKLKAIVVVTIMVLAAWASIAIN